MNYKNWDVKRKEYVTDMKIQLSDHFSYRKLLHFTFPSIIMLVFTSIYGVVDGFFVSNFVGKTPFTAVNFIMPFLMILGASGFMFGTGGGALISKTMGEGKREQAQRLFSMIVYISAAIGVGMALGGLLFLRPLAAALGAEPTPASLENRPRLMPSMTTEPAKPPAIDWKLKADWKMVPNTAGSSPMLVTVVHTASTM